MDEIHMNKLEALRFVSEHFGYEGQESNTFNDLLADRSTDEELFTIKELTLSIKKEAEPCQKK